MNEKPLCFVIIPFDERFKSVYEVIKSAAEEEGFVCERADTKRGGIIHKKIFERIFYANAIIADLTDDNPNVFYEIGVAHTIGRKTVMISQNRERKVFDIENLADVIYYSMIFEGSNKLREDLKKLLRHLKGGGTVDNPAQVFLPKTSEQQKINELADKTTRIIERLAESRIIELEMVKEKFGKWDPKLFSSLDEDIEKWKKTMGEDGNGV
ncbi:MAG: hypothetical protein WBE22_03395 [Halobacteriota archaeon]